MGTTQLPVLQPKQPSPKVCPAAARIAFYAVNPVRGIAAIALLLLAVSCGGGAGSTPAPTPTTPSITSFSPASGVVGAAVTITGTKLTGATAVSFNGVAATFSVASAAQITTTVPTGATTGKIAVSTPEGNATSSSNFTVTVPTPTISSFSPTSGSVGASVTVTGTNLTGATALSFNGTAATSFTINSATQITAVVPAGATTGKISVTTPLGSATSTNNFTVTTTAPSISSFTPTSAQVGALVTFTGANFTGTTAVSFNGTLASSFTVNSATQISTSVPTGATTGKISVTTPNGTAMSSANFTVNPASGSLDLTIDGLYVTQATQDYPDASVPLVKNRSGWVRVFVKANQSNTATPQVRVQFINGSTTNTLTINASGSSVPTSIDTDVDQSWDAAVPSSWIQPGVQVAADVDPTSAISESDKTNNHFLQTLDVRTLNPWKLTLIPVHTTDGKTGAVTTSSPSRTASDWVDFAKRLHPVPDTIDVTVGSTMNSSAGTLSSDGTGWSTVLNEVYAKRTADHITDRYYYGVVKVGYNSGVAGLGFVGAPAAMGWDYSSGPSVLAHEIGHNFGRPHSPCGGAGNPDLNYPYAGGIIGVTGWDAFASSNNLKVSTVYTDVMGYCNTQWISDYVYKSILDFRENNSFDIATDVVGGPQEGLLVWGRIENGQTILEPAFRVTSNGVLPNSGPYTWEARDSMGNVVASTQFDATEVADLPNESLRIFSFIVPMTDETINAVQTLHLLKEKQELARIVAPSRTAIPRVATHPQFLSGHRAQLTWDAISYPVVMLRDAKTGEVRGFLRGGSALLEDVPDNLEVESSDGVHSQTVSFQRPAQ